VRASNEVTVDRREFLAAVTRVPRGGLRNRAQYTPRTTLQYADPPMLIVETPYVRTEVAATGLWEQPVAVGARLLITVAWKLPKTNRITLLYLSHRLYFDRLSIDATPAPGMAPAENSQLGENRTSMATSKPSASPILAEGNQLLVPGLAPVTDRERLEQLAKAPMRPRRR
jgi:hypothetical protein